MWIIQRIHSFLEKDKPALAASQGNVVLSLIEFGLPEENILKAFASGGKCAWAQKTDSTLDDKHSVATNLLNVFSE